MYELKQETSVTPPRLAQRILKIPNIKGTL